MTLFRPCIDLHQGQVKQIVGGSLNDRTNDCLSYQSPTTNFVSEYDAAYYAQLYAKHGLQGGHVIALGAGNQQQTLQALTAWPQGLQYGGGVTLDNAASYLNAGASHVIVTSWLFVEEQFSWQRLQQLKETVGRERLVLDLSCRQHQDTWYIATNRWQTMTDTEINADTLHTLADYCAEFLIHSADVEGLQQGIDEPLVRFLGEHCSIPVTYAGGARHADDLRKVEQLSQGRVDLTIGSALDIFGGQGITLQECIAWNKARI